MTKYRFLSLLIVIVILFTSCINGEVTDGTTDNTTEAVSETNTSATEGSGDAESNGDTESGTGTDTEEPTYRESISRSREELEEMLTLTDEDFDKAQDQLEDFLAIAVVGTDYDEVDAVYLKFEDTFYYLQTQIGIANVIYYIDMSDTQASEKYLNSYSKFGDLYNLYAEACKEIYNKSPIRDELFADWTESEIREMLDYDPEVQELREKNEELLVELNALGEDEFTDRSAELYALIVTNNNKIAKLSGYDNYYVYASEKIYCRDYGIEEIEDFVGLVKEYYVENFSTVNGRWMGRYAALSQSSANDMFSYLFDPFDQLGVNYLESYIWSLDGSMREGLEHMFKNRNVVFANSPESHPSAFQTYFNDLETPFCLFGSEGQTTETLVHEMGHYYAALHNPDLESIDLAETHSQGNEMLLMNYLSRRMPSSLYNAIESYNLFMYLAESIVCVIIDEFERAVYSLESVEGYTSADFDAIMEEVCEEYGGKEFVDENITDINYYWRLVATNNPVYYISYAVSMTEALNIFAEVDKDLATGKEKYRIIVEDVEKDETFLAAMERAGLTSPFEKETFDKIIAVMTE